MTAAPQPSVSALADPSTRPNRAAEPMIVLGIDRRGLSAAVELCSRARPPASATAAKAMLMYMHQRQLAQSVSAPPSRSPTAPEPPATAPKIANALLSSCSSLNVHDHK